MLYLDCFYFHTTITISKEIVIIGGSAPSLTMLQAPFITCCP